jgi:hypothetical protein
MGACPNLSAGASPAADCGVPEASWHKPAGLESDPAHGAHVPCQAPGVPSGVRDVDKIEQGNCADARHAGGQGALEHPLPRVRTLLSLLSARLI